MMRRAILAALLAIPGVALAQTPAAKPESPIMRIPPTGQSAAMWKRDPAAAAPEAPPRRFVARRTGRFGGTAMRYTVTAEDTVLRDTAGEATGAIFSFSYLKDAKPGEQRPVLFVFNGGPGSSSVWLHMGVLGPRTVAFRDVTPRQVPPFRVVDNPDSALGVADLVFIDPIGTGFSRWFGKGRPADFYGREPDAAATLQFVNRWLRAHGRWNSPKFLLGESYGTVRANLLARRLMGGFLDGTMKGVSLNGVVLVGGDGGLANPVGNDRFRITFTTMAATAWQHDRVDKAARDFDGFIAEADRFARERLVPALDRWDVLAPAERAALAHDHARFTGLGEALLLDKGLRIQPSDFIAALLADKGQAIGMYDTRYVLPAAGSGGDPVADDPAMGQYSAPFIGAFNTYIRDELGVAVDEDYVVIDWVNVNMPWDAGQRDPAAPAGTAFAGVGDPGADLAAAMRRNPDLRLMLAEGWYDAFGAVGTAQYGIAQRKLPAERVELHAYRSGHMPYVGAAGAQFAADLRRFIVTASQGSPQ